MATKPTKKPTKANKPQRPPTSSGIVESPNTGKVPPNTETARQRRTAYLTTRMKREMRHNPSGLGSNSNTNTGGVSEGGMVSPYTLS
jgi:hypothetical protein